MGSAAMAGVHERAPFLLLLLIKISLSSSSSPVPEDVRSIGRQFSLGASYDARTSQVFPDRSLWSDQTIKENSEQVSNFATSVEVFSEARTLGRCKQFGLSSSLTLDFMSELVDSYGAADFMRTAIESECQISVALWYSAKTTRDILQLFLAPIDNYQECNSSHTTHAVTTVTYGLECVLEFIYLGSLDLDPGTIKEELEIAVSLIPAFSISGGGEADLTEMQQEIVENSSLVVYHDTYIDVPLPYDYDSGIMFFKYLPSLLGTPEDDYQGAVIVDAHLTPISDLCDDIDIVVDDISDTIVETLTSTMDKFQQLNIKIRTLIFSDVAQLFQPLWRNLKSYDEALELFSSTFQENLQTMIPQVREGSVAEDDLAELVSQVTSSAFELSTSSRFLDNRARETTALSHLIKDFPTDPSNIA